MVSMVMVPGDGDYGEVFMMVLMVMVVIMGCS